MDQKIRGRYEATWEEWKLLRKIANQLQLGGCACGCGRTVGSFHHLVSRSQGGDDVLSNLAGLYGDGTTGCHGALTSGNRVNDGVNFPGREARWIYPEVVRVGIRNHLRPDQRAYIISRTGEWYLDKHYPSQ